MNDVVPLESAVVKRIMRLLVSRDVWYVKTTGVSKVGCPDILACYKGVFVAIEVKRPGGTPSRKQVHELRKVVDAGGFALIAEDVKTVENCLDLIDSGPTT